MGGEPAPNQLTVQVLYCRNINFPSSVPELVDLFAFVRLYSLAPGRLQLKNTGRLWFGRYESGQSTVATVTAEPEKAVLAEPILKALEAAAIASDSTTTGT